MAKTKKQTDKRRGIIKKSVVVKHKFKITNGTIDRDNEMAFIGIVVTHNDIRVRLKDMVYCGTEEMITKIKRQIKDFDNVEATIKIKWNRYGQVTYRSL